MKASLILCTKNGGDRLVTCLEHIEALDAPPDFEVLLVDNGSTDGTSYRTLRDYGAESKVSCKVLQTLKPGNSVGRNAALKEAGGDLLIFIDDDCYADAQLVRDWISIFTARPEIGFASGRITKFDPAQSDLGCVESQYEEIIPPRSFLRRGLIQGSNMAFRAECLKTTGPFDARFGAGTSFAGEEWDLALRASMDGWIGGYVPGPTVHHDHRRLAKQAYDRLKYYDYGAGAVYAKNIFTSWMVEIFLALAREMRDPYMDLGRKRALLSGCMNFLTTYSWRKAA